MSAHRHSWTKVLLGCMLLGMLVVMLVSCKKETQEPKDIEGEWVLDSCRTMTLADSSGNRVVFDDVTWRTTYCSPGIISNVRLEMEDGNATQTFEANGKTTVQTGTYTFNGNEMILNFGHFTSAKDNEVAFLDGAYEDVWILTSGLFFRKKCPMSPIGPGYTNCRIEQTFYFSED